MLIHHFWALFASTLFIAFGLLPLIPQINSSYLLRIELEPAEHYWPPSVHYVGDPWSWRYQLTFHSLCRTFLWYDGKDVMFAPMGCVSGNHFNISESWLGDNVNATTDSDWPLSSGLQHVDFTLPFGLYLLGYVLGVAGCITLGLVAWAKRKFSLVEGTFRLTSLVFLIAGVALAQTQVARAKGPSPKQESIYGRLGPSNVFLGLTWTSIGLQMALCVSAGYDIWKGRVGTPRM